MSELEILYPQIPFNATSMQESDATATGFSTYNLSTASRSLLHKLNAQATSLFNTWKQWDLGYGETDTANYLALARADLLRASGCTSASVRASTVSRNTIDDLALSSLKLHLDAGTGVTINSTRQVSQWNDQSGNSYNFTQSTSANKPVYSRADNKENLFIASEDLSSGTGWSLGRAAVTVNAVANPVDGALTADLMYDDATAANTHYITHADTVIKGVYTGLTYRVSCYAKRAGRDLGIRFGSDWGNKYAHFNLATGAVHSVDSGVSASITSMGDDWYRLIATCTTTAMASTDIDFYMTSPVGTVNYNGDSASGVYLFGLQLQESAADTTYLSTTDHQQYRGVNGFPALVFDGTDDVMTSTATLANIVTNSAFTMFAVVQTKAVPALNARILTDSGDFLMLRYGAANADIVNNDGAADTASVAYTTNSVEIIEARHDAGLIYIRRNNGTENSATSGNTSTLTGTLLLGNISTLDRDWTGNVSELLVFNAALTAAQRSTIYTYLATKYTTTAAAICDIESATLVGPFEQDYVTTFSATTASRYYWFDMWCNVSDSAQRFPLSKVYLGTRYTFDSTDPVYPYSANYRKPLRDFVADSGTMFRSREGREQLEYTFQWFLDDDTRDDFMDKIGRYWDVNPIMLYTPSTGFAAALNSHTLVHGWIDALNIRSTGPVANQNTLTLEVIQDV